MKALVSDPSNTHTLTQRRERSIKKKRFILAAGSGLRSGGHLEVLTFSLTASKDRAGHHLGETGSVWKPSQRPWGFILDPFRDNSLDHID